jgi:ABC-type transport system involved in cytochrome bd biosynthesis fused ATPase/permease subunit
VDEFVATFRRALHAAREQGVQLSGGHGSGSHRAGVISTPTLLVMDEATASLDVTAEREITAHCTKHRVR